MRDKKNAYDCSNGVGRNSFIPNFGQLEVLDSWTSFLISGLKLGILVAVPLGLWLVAGYLISEGAPLPVSDASIATTLLIVMATYLFGASVLVTSAFFPVLFCYVSPKMRARTKMIIVRSAMDRKSNSIYLGSQYLVFQLAPFCAMLSLFTAFCTVRTGYILATILLAACLGALTSTAIFWVRSSHMHLHVSEMRLHVYRRVIALRLCGGGLLRAFWATLWTLVCIQMITLASSGIIPRSPGWSDYFGIAILIILLAVFAFFTSARVIVTRVPFALLFIVVSIAFLFPARLGRTTLQAMGIGGGIPVTIVTKSPGQSSSQAAQTPITGCLILNAGGEAVLRPNAHPTADTCSASSSSFINPPSQQRLGPVSV